MRIFRNLLYLLTFKERKHAALLVFMIIIMSFLDAIGVASILPFMAVLSNPSLIETNQFLSLTFKFFYQFGFETNQQFLILLGFLVFFILIVSLIFKTLTTYVQVRFVQMREFTIGKLLMKGYLYQPYAWFLNRHSADLGKTILSEVQQLILNGIKPFSDLIAQGMIVIALILLLFLSDPITTIAIGLLLGGAYSVIFYFIKKFIKRIGHIRLENNQIRFTSIIEAFGAIKEVKVFGLENEYIKKFSNSANIFADTQSSSQVIAQLPRFILEAIAFGGILLIILNSMSKSGNFNNVLPMLSLYIFAGYRLMPALQKIYAAFTQITFIGPSLKKICDDIEYLKFNKNRYIDYKSIKFKQFITLKNISYQYPNSSKFALKNVNLDITAGHIVGLVGTTGSGKTTLVDVILGLLIPQDGLFKVDKTRISDQNLRSWQNLIGYVPQNIYLADDTIEANIAFGIDKRNVNKKAIVNASKVANLDTFVNQELPEKYQTIIGERGVRLSGGQLQRIGIARALYHKPKILILDEATSALDNHTEKMIMEEISKINKITIIMIAHRLNTVKNCDKIFVLERGEIKGQGSYQQLIRNNDIFRKNALNVQP